MSFPDQAFLHQLQEDLWQWPSSRAAVMVGAGLSLNSEPLPGVRTQFPTWRDLVRLMFDELYPREPSQTQAQSQERNEHFLASSALRIASEYEAAFGRQKLELLIKNSNPDHQHLPGRLHYLLLQLPWKDVFTTNYDTLLERTEVSGRYYQPVITASELSSTFSPRIVKLHGSLPSQTPFIITEEDYRTYPDRFAPFSNTVKQSLIENSLVLLGFSGEDPNFLQWIGWIRDQLGAHHAPIYFVSADSLGNAQRMLLKSRGVTVIDLSPLFSEKDSANRHADSLEWFLGSLEAAKPRRPEQWLEQFFPPSQYQLKKPPIIGSRSELSSPPRIGLSPNNNGPLEEKHIAKLFSEWSFERKQYPGWLVAPNNIRGHLWELTKNWIIPLIDSITYWPAADRILVLRELNWRFEVAMAPLFAEPITAMKQALEDLQQDLESGKKVSASIEAMPFNDASCAQIIEASLEIGFGLLREARETFDPEKWLRLKEILENLPSENSISEDRRCYEEALWKISNVERAEAMRVLEKWNPSETSPLALMWKASLLAEIDEPNVARSLLRTALRSTRNALLRQGQNLELLSIEGWCTFLLFAVEQSLPWRSGQPLHECLESRELLRQEFQARWSELKAWDCDPWSIKAYFDQALASSPPSRRQSDNDISYCLPAFAYIRLFERVGIPMRLRRISIIDGESLLNACKWIYPYIAYWSPAILVRAVKTKELKNFLSTSIRVSMEPEIAARLHQWALHALRGEIPGSIRDAMAEEDLLEILTALLSRLAFRVNTDQLQQAFELALRIHCSPGIRSNWNLHNVCEAWFKQIFNSASDLLLFQFLPNLLRAPLFDKVSVFDEVSSAVFPERERWPDPMGGFPEERLRLADLAESELRKDVETAINWLLKRAHSETGESRRRIIIRLIKTYYSNLMTEAQKSGFGVLIWEYNDVEGLPDLNVYPGDFLELPAPLDIDVGERVRAHLLNLTPSQSVLTNSSGDKILVENQEDQYFRQIVFCTKPALRLIDEVQGSIEWNQQESKIIFNKALDWWNSAKFLLSTDAPFAGDGPRKELLNTIQLFDRLLARAVIPKLILEESSVWEKINEIRSEASSLECDLYISLPYLLLSDHTGQARVESAISDGLASKNAGKISEAACAVRHWLNLAQRGLIRPPETKLLNTLIHHVLFRKPEGINACMKQISCLLVEVPDCFTFDIIELLIGSLGAWPRIAEQAHDSKSDFDSLVLRRSLGVFAGGLSGWIRNIKPELDEPGEITLWRELCLRDPLPEVNRSFRYLQDQLHLLQQDAV